MRRRSRKKSTAQKVRDLSRRLPRPRMRQVFNTDQLALGVTWSTAELLNGIAQGDDDDERTSDSVLIKSIEWRFAFTSATAIDAAANVRYIIVVDKQSNGNVATPSTIFHSTDSIVSGYDNVYVPRRYRVIADESFTLNEWASNATVTSKKYIKRKKTYKSGIKIRYKNIFAGIGDIMAGGLQLFFITDQSANPPSVSFETKVQYVDV